MKKLIVIILFLLSLTSLSTMASAAAERILLDDPNLVDNSIHQSYDLQFVNLRLPEIEMDNFNKKNQDKLLNLATLYGSNESSGSNNVLTLKNIKNGERLNTYKLKLDSDNNRLSLNPLPGVSVNANFDQKEDELIKEENTNVSLLYWMTNRTLIRAEYDQENKEWWDIDDILLGDDMSDEIKSITEENADKELVYNEEKKESGRLGIIYQTNDYITISADYINNDTTSFINDYSTAFGVEYKDEYGSLRYRYQMDFGEIKRQVSGLELGYKDLATFNATYKMFDPEALQDQLEDEWNWDFGLDVNLNNISSISLGYQLKKDSSSSNSSLEEEEEKESNIQAQLKIKF